MARYLSTIPSNLGFFNLGTVWSYPTGGSGPTAYGSTGYFGSTPEPEVDGSSLYSAIDLGDLSIPLRTITLSGTHGGLTRRQSSFYKLKLVRPRSIQVTQDFSQFAYTAETNRNTLISFYQIVEGTRRVELPINNSGYVYKSTGVDYDTDESPNNGDYPNIRLGPGDYAFVITNDIKYLETSYSISLNVAVTDWRFVTEDVEESLDFRSVAEGADTFIDFGTLAA